MSAIRQAFETESSQDEGTEIHRQPLEHTPPKKPPQRVSTVSTSDPLLTVEDVARRLNLSRDWVWDHSSRKSPKLPVIQLDLVEPLGEIPLFNFDIFSLQLHLNKLATTGSKDRVLQMRAYLRDIFAEAVDQDFLVKDPARKIKVPAQLRATDTTTLTWEQLRLALSKLSLRDRILLELDMTNALRPSELFAFRWSRFDHKASTLTVAETVYKGSIRDWGKTRKSLSVIHIPSELADDLRAWHLECREKARMAAEKDRTKPAVLSPDAFIFANEVGGFLDTDNYRKRVLHKPRSRP